MFQKTAVFLAFHFVVLCSSAQMPFPGNGKWIFNSGGMWGFHDPIVRVVTDTIELNGLTYFQLGSEESCPMQDFDTGTVLLREEENRWWVLFPGGAEVLWCDFNLQAGDTLHYNHPLFAAYSMDNDSTETYIVYEQSTVTLTDGIERQQWKLYPVHPEIPDFFPGGWDLHWIEGIGSLDYFDHVVPPFYFDTGWNYLTCFTSTGEDPFMINPQNQTGCCWVGSVEHRTTGSLMIYPNPADSQIQLTLNEGTLLPGEIVLIDASGRSLTAQEIRVPQSTVTIHLDDFPSGVYTLQYTSTNGYTYSERFVKQ